MRKEAAYIIKELWALAIMSQQEPWEYLWIIFWTCLVKMVEFKTGGKRDGQPVRVLINTYRLEKAWTEEQEQRVVTPGKSHHHFLKFSGPEKIFKSGSHWLEAVRSLGRMTLQHCGKYTPQWFPEFFPKEPSYTGKGKYPDSLRLSDTDLLIFSDTRRPEVWSQPPLKNFLDIHFSVNFKNLFIFNWRIIASQYCVGFYQTSTWISCRFTLVPSQLSIPPRSLPIPPL